MMLKNKNLKNTFAGLLALCFFIPAFLSAQHRGDNINFQGLMEKNNTDVVASSMGGAYTAVIGGLSSMFYNPAGLARLDKIQFSVAVNNNSREWRESQDYRPDRLFVTLPFYLEGWYMPLRSQSGQWDFNLAKDSNYYVNPPLLGVDPYSSEAADWINKKNKFGLSNISVAIPFSIADMKIVAAAGFNRDNNFSDFDRNDTYLNPHLGYFDYGGDISRVGGLKTLNVKWSRFARQRYGNLNTITANVSTEILENVMIGAGANVMWGQSEDMQSLVSVGNFFFSAEQRFKFTYIDRSLVTTGNSDYNGVSFYAGAIVQLERVKVGFKVDLPYTINRDWSYSTSVIDSTLAPVVTNTSGKDKIEIPATVNFGISFEPADNFMVAFDYELAPFSKTKFALAVPDSTLRNWFDRNTLSYGAQYKPFECLTLRAGYRTISQLFVPDGAAVKDKGPEAESYNFGFSINLSFGRFDFAYEYRKLKYYDSYFSNTNYSFNSNSSIMAGFTYTLN